jgi:hypothetical protein
MQRVQIILVYAARWMAVLLLATGSPCRAAEATTPKFDQFKVAVRSAQRTGSADVDRGGPEETLEQFMARVVKVGRRGSNFAGHYAIVRWGCGFVCQDGSVIEVSSGRVWDLPFRNVSDCPNLNRPLLEFRNDSRLLIVNGVVERERPAPDLPCGTYYFEWLDGNWKQINGPAEKSTGK